MYYIHKWHLNETVAYATEERETLVIESGWPDMDIKNPKAFPV